MKNPASFDIAFDGLPSHAPNASCRAGMATRNAAPLFDDLPSLLRWRAAQHGERLAYLFLKNGEIEEGRYTYADLDQKAKAVAAGLQTAGARPGDAVVLLLPQGLDYIAAFFGCLYAGVIAVPSYPPVRKIHIERLGGIVEDCEAHFLITTHDILAAFQAQIDAIPALHALTKLDIGSVHSANVAAWCPPPIQPDALAFLQYTSGSTGTPKGVMVSHANIMANQAMLAEGYDSDPNSSNGSWLPFFHDMGLVEGLLQPLYLGAPGYLMTPLAFIQKPVRWLQMISRYRVRVSGAPNFAYDLCLRQVTDEQMALLDLSCWEVAYNGAEPIRADTLRRFVARFKACGLRPTAPYPCYGMAETTLIATGGHAYQAPRIRTVDGVALEQGIAHDVPEDTPGARSLVGVGRVLVAGDIRIVDPDTLIPCPPNRVGEIWLTGPHIAQGYWRNPDATQRDFQARLSDSDAGPFLRTGDLGLMDNDGELYITSRLKDLIIIRGRNFIPADIEQVVEKAHPALCENGVAAFSVTVEGQETLNLVAEITKDGENDLAVDELAQAIRTQVLAAFDLKVERIAFIRRAKLPRTTSGKIQRRTCQRQFLAGDLTLLGLWPASAHLPNPHRALATADACHA